VDTYRTEEEQVEAIKSWWKTNGTSTVMTVVVAIAIVVGWRGWQDQQVENASIASSLYQNLFVLQQTISQTGNGQVSAEDLATANHLTEQLKDEYGSSAYARYAALLKAKRDAEKGDFSAAEAELDWAIEHSESGLLTDEDAPLLDLLQLRLAKVQVAQEKFDEATAILANIVSKQFVALAQELEGDIYFARGELEKARESYQVAMDNEDRPGSTEILRIKMSNL